MNFVDCDLVAIAEDVGSAYADQALAKNVDLELAALDRPVSAQVVARPDRRAARQPARQRPSLHAGGADESWSRSMRIPPTIRVSDSGPGIAEDEREAVFDRFARAGPRAATAAGSAWRSFARSPCFTRPSVALTDQRLGRDEHHDRIRAGLARTGQAPCLDQPTTKAPRAISPSPKAASASPAMRPPPKSDVPGHVRRQRAVIAGRVALLRARRARRSGSRRRRRRRARATSRG